MWCISMWNCYMRKKCGSRHDCSSRIDWIVENGNCKQKRWPAWIPVVGWWSWLTSVLLLVKIVKRLGGNSSTPIISVNLYKNKEIRSTDTCWITPCLHQEHHYEQIPDERSIHTKSEMKQHWFIHTLTLSSFCAISIHKLTHKNFFALV